MNYIVNPKNGKTVSIFSNEGKRILRNYLLTLKKMGGRKKNKKCSNCGRYKLYKGFKQ